MTALEVDTASSGDGACAMNAFSVLRSEWGFDRIDLDQIFGY